MDDVARYVSHYSVSILLGALMAAPAPMAFATESTLMPVPASVEAGSGRLALTADYRVAFSGVQDARLVGALARTLRAVEMRTGLVFARTATGAYVPSVEAGSAGLVIECAKAGEAIPQLGEDESYFLEITPARALLRAPTALGVLRGLATLQQLVQSDPVGWFLPALVITDQPRFPWRGLMLDVCRHWQPMDVVKRNVDGMALVKLNVLHLHLTEDQGFRIESKTFPRLHQMGSDGHFFTQDEMREIIAYAAERGIRVVPEFDIPGHATSWLVGHPELGSAPGPYSIERKWGVFNPVLDPSNEEVYRVLDGFLGEMAALFPDPYLHIGGDENNGRHWSANASLQQFIRDHNLKDNAGLHAYFNTRVNKILTKHGKKLVGWDEILHPDLPAGSVVHSWRGPDGIAAATKQGFATLLSNGYYIDLNYPASQHYLNDPIPPGSPLTADQQKLVLGGEAPMWAEWVTPELIDSRIWPRTAAIAERLWSPVTVRDVPDMYRRLAIVSRRLEEIGLKHVSYIDPALRRLAGDQATVEDLRALRVFVDLLEPVKQYKRGQLQPDATQFTPLTGLVDCARADSAPAREFAAAVDELLRNPRSSGAAARVSVILYGWRGTGEYLLGRLPSLSPRLAEAQPLLQALVEASEAGLSATAGLRDGKDLDAAAATKTANSLKHAGQTHAAVEIPAAPAIVRLVTGRP
jgi:hexosaminidase